MEKTRVTYDDVADLCEELGVIKNPSEDIWDCINEDIETKGIESFLERYTQALLDSIAVGSSNLTGTVETYKGFGKRLNKIHVQMILKTSCGDIMP